jgi:putative membrane protein
MLYIKSLHIIFVVTWFAGLFYFVRLLVYHAEAQHKQEPERSVLLNHFLGAEKRLWYGITWPSAVLTWFFGLKLALGFYANGFPSWLWVKIGFVAGLTVYHLWCGYIRRQFANGIFNWSSTGLRIFNEVATLFLVAVVFLVVLKDELEWILGVTGFVVFGIVLMVAISVYKKIRQREKNS